MVEYDDGSVIVVFFGNHPCPVASMAKLCYVGWASPMPSHFYELARLNDPKVMFLICNDL